MPKNTIIIDDSSVDTTKEILKKCNNVCVYDSSGSGPQEARNYGFSKVDTKYVAFLDHDDIWHPSHLETLVGILEENPVCPAAASQWKKFSDTVTHFEDASGEMQKVTELNAWSKFPSCPLVSPSGVLIRSRSLREIGGWKYGDYYMWLRLSSLHTMVQSNLKTLYYRVSASQCSNTRRFNSSGYARSRLYEPAVDAVRQHIRIHGTTEHVKHLRSLKLMTELCETVDSGNFTEARRKLRALIEYAQRFSIKEFSDTVGITTWLLEGHFYENPSTIKEIFLSSFEFITSDYRYKQAYIDRLMKYKFINCIVIIYGYSSTILILVFISRIKNMMSSLFYRAKISSKKQFPSFYRVLKKGLGRGTSILS